jgi:hypothetical protein
MSVAPSRRVVSLGQPSTGGIRALLPQVATLSSDLASSSFRKIFDFFRDSTVRTFLLQVAPFSQSFCLGNGLDTETAMSLPYTGLDLAEKVSAASMCSSG